VSDSCSCKVGRVARRRGLDGLPATLRARWTAAEDRASLRDLAERFNVAVVRAALSGTGLGESEPEAAAVYELLTDEETSAGRRTAARRRLAGAGVDVEALREDLLSHQTVHTHLRECADAAYEDGRTDAERLSDAADRLFALQGRTEAVTRETVASLRDAGLVDVGAADVVVDVTVTCRDCGRGRSVARLLEDGGCPCREG
jgi:DNA-binding transcriptional ArsR family regulator